MLVPSITFRTIASTFRKFLLVSSDYNEEFNYLALHSYFIAHILDLQLHKALCKEADEYDPEDPAKPLHKCDIDGSTRAGDLLRAGLSLGRSVHWSEALKAMTGETELKTDALLEYYAPLHEFLKRENEKADKDAGVSLVLSSSLVIAVTAVNFLDCCK